MLLLPYAAFPVLSGYQGVTHFPSARSRPGGQDRVYLGLSKARVIPAWIDAALVAGPCAGPAACAVVCTIYSSGVCRDCFSGARGYM